MNDKSKQEEITRLRKKNKRNRKKVLPKMGERSFVIEKDVSTKIISLFKNNYI